MAAIWFFAGAALLLAALALGYLRWWRSLADLSRAARVTLILTTVGGLIGAVFWWQDMPASFAWDLPPLASRMLGAAATAFGIAGLFVLERPTQARGRLHALVSAIYLIPLAVAAIALHLDRFDLAAPISWGFFAAVGVLSISAVVALSADRGGAPRSLVFAGQSAWLLVAGTLLALWGLALFLAPATAFPLVFNWPADALTSRLIAAMLLTVAAAFLVARGDAPLVPQALLLGAVYGLGVVIAIVPNMLRGLPWPPLYLAAFAVLGIVSAGFLLAGRARAG